MEAGDIIFKSSFVERTCSVTKWKEAGVRRAVIRVLVNSAVIRIDTEV